MFIFDFFSTLFKQLEALLIQIPLNNGLSVVYAAGSIILLLFAALISGGTTGGGGGIFGGLGQ